MSDTRPLSMHEIAQAFLERFSSIDAAEGEVSEHDQEALDALTSALESKAEVYALVIAELQAKSAAAREVGKLYGERAARATRHAERMTARLLDALRAAGRSNVKTPTATVTIQASPPALRLLVADSEVPERFARMKREIDRAAIKTALANGEPLEFAALERGEHIRIR